jgi:hypothetical protein
MSDGVGKIYSGAATFGKFSAIISGIIGTLIALIIAGVGIWIMIDSARRTQTSVGIITQSNCNNVTPGNTSTCNITVSYAGSTASQRCMLETFVPNRSIYDKGEQVTVFYDPSDPCNSGSLDSKEDSSIIGISLIISAVVIIAIVWLVVWLTQKYKFFAAAEGVGTVARVFI